MSLVSCSDISTWAVLGLLLFSLANLTASASVGNSFVYSRVAPVVVLVSQSTLKKCFFIVFCFSVVCCLCLGFFVLLVRKPLKLTERFVFTSKKFAKI